MDRWRWAWVTALFTCRSYRVDATLYRKFLPGRNLVGSVGVGYYNAPDGHTDRSLSLGAAYYFEAPWIVEGGVRLNTQQPGFCAGPSSSLWP